MIRLLVAVAVVAGGFVALTNSGTAAEGLPAVPTSNRAVVSRAPASADSDLASWQETRITVPTSNVIPKK